MLFNRVCLFRKNESITTTNSPLFTVNLISSITLSIFTYYHIIFYVICFYILFIFINLMILYPINKLLNLILPLDNNLLTLFLLIFVKTFIWKIYY